MKIIDLLNKIANGEEVPKKFEVNGRIWEWNVYSYNCELHSEFSVTGLRYDLSNLNDEIKILDIEYLNNDLEDKLIKPFLEEKKIPEKLKNYYDENLEEYVVETYIKGINYKEIFNSRYDEMIISKINEVLDYLKSKGE